MYISVYKHMMKAFSTIDSNLIPGGDTLRTLKYIFFINTNVLHQNNHCKPTIICDNFFSRFTLDVVVTYFCNQAFFTLAFVVQLWQILVRSEK